MADPNAYQLENEELITALEQAVVASERRARAR